jgi:hypothetical protein
MRALLLFVGFRLAGQSEPGLALLLSRLLRRNADVDGCDLAEG